MEVTVVILILIILFCLFFRPSKGKAGEKTVSRKLSRLPKDEYKVLNDIMLSTPKGTTQIDHIVISIYGIFVIETKNYNGWIDLRWRRKRVLDTEYLWTQTSVLQSNIAECRTRTDITAYPI